MMHCHLHMDFELCSLSHINFCCLIVLWLLQKCPLYLYLQFLMYPLPLLLHFLLHSFVFVPTMCTVPAATPAGLSLTPLSTSTGLPNEGASSCTPPESVKIK